MFNFVDNNYIIASINRTQLQQPNRRGVKTGFARSQDTQRIRGTSRLAIRTWKKFRILL